MDVSPSDTGGIEVNNNPAFSYPSSFIITSDEFVTLEATAAPGYRFDGWEGDLESTTNPVTVPITSNKKIIARFSRISRILTIQVNGNGSTSPPGGTYEINGGDTVAITATPDSGWEFASWTGDSSETDPDVSFIIDSDTLIMANFAERPIKWWIIAAIVAGCVIIGIIVFFSKRSGPGLLTHG